MGLWNNWKRYNLRAAFHRMCNRLGRCQGSWAHEPGVERLTVFELTTREPTCIIKSPTFPLDEILEPVAVSPLINDGTNLKFLDSIGCNKGPRVRQVVRGKTRVVIHLEGAKQASMKRRKCFISIRQL